MTDQEKKDVTLNYIETLNRHDLEGLSQIITFDHKFSGVDGEVRQNRRSVMSGWEAFFKMCPDYCVHVSDFLEVGEDVILTGRTSSGQPSKARSEEFDQKLLFKSSLRGGKVSEWIVLKDTPHNRKKLR